MPITKHEFETKPEILALPQPIQKKLSDFIYKEIPKTPFFKPDGKPKKEWKIFYGDTRDAALDAAWDAALLARFLVVDDLKFKDKEKHLKHVLARWEVWQKGYGLLCDVDGVLYVYCKGKPPQAKPITNREAREQLAGFEQRITKLEKELTEARDKLKKIAELANPTPK